MPIENVSECRNCGKVETKYNTMGLYCSNKCQLEYQRSVKISEWLAGNRSWKSNVPTWAKNYLLEQVGNKCSECGIDEWNGKSLSLEVDHIDGIHYNNSPENLRILCPNCHSTTDTYKNRNRGKGRTLNSPVS
jgi:Zn finger protein HypA/HybF involved in hydrogenase expression